MFSDPYDLPGQNFLISSRDLFLIQSTSREYSNSFSLPISKYWSVEKASFIDMVLYFCIFIIHSCVKIHSKFHSKRCSSIANWSQYHYYYYHHHYYYYYYYYYYHYYYSRNTNLQSNLWAYELLLTDTSKLLSTCSETNHRRRCLRNKAKQIQKISILSRLVYNPRKQDNY